MTREKKIKLIKPSQTKGIRKSASTRKDATRQAIELACKTVCATKRPSIDNVVLAGAGAFSRSSLKERDRHRPVLEAWQRRWDEENPGQSKAKQSQGTSDEPAEKLDIAPVPASTYAKIQQELRHAKEQLQAALRHVGELDRRHLIDEEEKKQLRLAVARAQAERKERLPKRFSDSSDGTTQH